MLASKFITHFLLLLLLFSPHTYGAIILPPNSLTNGKLHSTPVQLSLSSEVNDDLAGIKTSFSAMNAAIPSEDTLLLNGSSLMPFAKFSRNKRFFHQLHYKYLVNKPKKNLDHVDELTESKLNYMFAYKFDKINYIGFEVSNATDVINYKENKSSYSVNKKNEYLLGISYTQKYSNFSWGGGISLMDTISTLKYRTSRYDSDDEESLFSTLTYFGIAFLKGMYSSEASYSYENQGGPTFKVDKRNYYQASFENRFQFDFMNVLNNISYKEEYADKIYSIYQEFEVNFKKVILAPNFSFKKVNSIQDSQELSTGVGLGTRAFTINPYLSLKRSKYEELPMGIGVVNKIVELTISYKI